MTRAIITRFAIGAACTAAALALVHAWPWSTNAVLLIGIAAGAFAAAAADEVLS